jgi:hypothetical protein
LKLLKILKNRDLNHPPAEAFGEELPVPENSTELINSKKKKNEI